MHRLRRFPQSLLRSANCCRTLLANFPRMKSFRFPTFAALGILALGLGACTTMPTTGKKNSFQFDPPVTQPTNKSAVKLKLSTGAQRLYVVEGDKVLLATPVTVGKSGTPTPHGNYTIYLKTAERRRISSPDSGYPMPYWMEFKSAYGLHWGFVKPYPSTHGCVRMPLKSAAKVFAITPTGAPINIATSQPWDATIGKSLPVLDDGPLPDPPKAYLLSSKFYSDVRQGKLWNF
jgi:L,D-transpeptidase catalytic domain